MLYNVNIKSINKPVTDNRLNRGGLHANQTIHSLRAAHIYTDIIQIDQQTTV